MQETINKSCARLTNLFPWLAKSSAQFTNSFSQFIKSVKSLYLIYVSEESKINGDILYPKIPHTVDYQ